MGRAAEWKREMAHKVRLADGTQVDMLDPVSIRDYVRQALALNVSPTAPELRRLEMLEEHAAKLEAAKVAADPPKLDTPDELAAARERLRKSLGNG